MLNLYYKVLKKTIDNLIDLSETPTNNTYYLCGINKDIIEYFCSTKWFGGVINDTKEFHIIKSTKNGIIFNYKGNHVILQKDVRENRILYDNSRCNTWHYDFYNKPLKELNIVDISELEDDI